ncbi:MAG TPA: hypothetical protein VKI61_06025 [Chitinophagaceae bacterium]|jgi:hypothetical protein|nr:hypothetical protein [Chitinophagaceae bacterium]
MKLDDLHDLPQWEDDHFKQHEDGEQWKYRNKKQRAKALYNQWRQVYLLVNGLLSILEPEDETPENYLESMKEMICGDAMLVCAKIQGAEAGDMYVLRMENASFIRASANSIYISMSSFRMMGIADDSHLDAVRREIDIFRNLFKAWVNGFEKDEFEDEWGLFKQ